MALNLVDEQDREYPPEIVQNPAPPLTMWPAAMIGQGASSNVVAGILGEERVAVRVLINSGKSAKNEIAKLVTIWSSLEHPRVLPCRGRRDMSFGQVALLSPFVENGTLMEFITNYPTENRLQLLQQVAEGVHYLHTKAGVVHGNLKCSNILISDDRTALLCGFGLSTPINPSTPPATPIRIQHTEPFAAPELFTDSAFESAFDRGNSSKRSKTTHSDIYAFGMLIYEVITSAAPWNDVSVHDISAKVLRGQRPTRTELFSDNLWNLCEECWAQDPFARPDISKVLAEITRLANAAH